MQTITQIVKFVGQISYINGNTNNNIEFVSQSCIESSAIFSSFRCGVLTTRAEVEIESKERKEYRKTE